MGENMINAYILISLRPGNTDEIINDMRKIENVEKISIVAGEYDIVVRVRTKSLENLLKVTNKIQMIDGVKKTTTQIVEKELAL
jgi:DNA-binding Lrp family transcriptional regulator